MCIASVLVTFSGCRTAPLPVDVLAEIGQLEDRRDPGHGRLQELLRHPRPEARSAAARALGRIGDANAVSALTLALADRSPAPRLAAVFALGQIGGPTAAEALVDLLGDPDHAVRAAAVAALGRTDTTAHWQVTSERLTDTHAEVRGAAALALVRQAGDRLRGRGKIDERARGDLIQRLGAALIEEPDPQTAWRIVYALAHMADPRAEAALLLGARPDATRWSRVFATRGLAALPATPTTSDRLLVNAADADPKVAFEAITALGARRDGEEGELGDRPRHDSPQALDLLLRTVANHASSAVRGAAAKSLATFAQERHTVLRALRAALEDETSTSARSAILVTLGRLGGPAEVAAALQHFDSDQWQTSVAAVRAYAACKPPHADALRELFENNEDVRVRTAVLDAMAAAPEQLALPDVGVRACEIEDLAVREAAARALAIAGDTGAAAALEAAYRDSPGIEFVPARKWIVRAIGTLAPNRRTAAIEFLRTALEDPALVVRKEALRQLTALEAAPRDPVAVPDDRVTPVLGRDIPWQFIDKQPRLTFTTTRGAFTIRLFPKLAPVHCFNLVTLAETGAYDGRVFHRVVPNFVVQGGDARGDGYGNRAYHGRTIRDEIGPLAFGAGVVGMPKSEDDDSGGDQIFITTVPTPHLDGSYTAFGEVTEGLEIVDALEVGDAITDIVVKFD